MAFGKLLQAARVALAAKESRYVNAAKSWITSRSLSSAGWVEGLDMDIEIARDMIRTAFRSSAELEGLLHMLKKHCSPEEYKDYARAVATAVHAVMTALIDKATAAYPELEAEIEAKIKKYGRYR